MLLLISGLILFIGMHSIRIFAVNWRSEQIEKRGESLWKGFYSLVALAGFLLMIWGYGDAKATTIILWNPPEWTKHLNVILNLPVFTLVLASYIPGTKIKSIIGNPMILGAKFWAIGHLISNGTLVDVILFGSFLIWAIVDFATAQRRDRAAGIKYEFYAYSRDAYAIVAGLVLWAAFVFYLHDVLIGVKIYL